MKRLRHPVICMFALLIAIAPMLAGEVIDRIVATVNRHAILESELDEAIRYESFLNQKPFHALSQSDRQATLQRLVDQALIAQEMERGNFHSSDASEVAAKVQEIRQQLLRDRKLQSGGDSEWLNAMKEYGLTQDEMTDMAARQLDELRYVDQRFRPSIHIDFQQVERYYNQTLVPQLRSSGQSPAPLEQVAPQIQELLTQQSLDELLSTWLRSLREQSTIEVR